MPGELKHQVFQTITSIYVASFGRLRQTSFLTMGFIFFKQLMPSLHASNASSLLGELAATSIFKSLSPCICTSNQPLMPVAVKSSERPGFVRRSLFQVIPLGEEKAGYVKDRVFSSYDLKLDRLSPGDERKLSRSLSRNA